MTILSGVKKTKILVIFFLSISLSALLPGHIFASEAGTPSITKDQLDALGRAQYAKTLWSFFKKIDEGIPSLSPAQEQWLDKEMKEWEKSGNSKRFWAIMSSKEYNARAVKDYIAGINNGLLLLSIPGQAEKKEMYIWSLITGHLMSPNEWGSMHHLIEDSIVDKKLFFQDSSEKIDGHLFYETNGVIPAWQILRYVIIPYLEKENLALIPTPPSSKP